MSADRPAPRHQSRERALTLLYEAELKGEPPDDVLAALPVAPDPYVTTLVAAVGARQDEIDAPGRRRRPSAGTSSRMAVVDRNVLRLAIAELLACDDVPDGGDPQRGGRAGQAFSTDDSGRFVNGVLATVATGVRP